MAHPATSQERFITGYRTRLKHGNEDAYRTLHSHVPSIVEQKLRAAGVLRWSIWTDGDTVFHSIETRDEYSKTAAALDALGQVDPAWDYAIGALVDSGEGSAALLQHVWTMDEVGQR